MLPSKSAFYQNFAIRKVSIMDIIPTSTVQTKVPKAFLKMKKLSLIAALTGVLVITMMPNVQMVRLALTGPFLVTNLKAVLSLNTVVRKVSITITRHHLSALLLIKI